MDKCKKKALSIKIREDLIKANLYKKEPFIRIFKENETKYYILRQKCLKKAINVSK